jgi:hypothetical protein
MNVQEVFENFVKYDKRQDDYDNIVRRIKEDRFSPVNYCFRVRFAHIFHWSTSCNNGSCATCWKANSKTMYEKKVKKCD